MVPNSFKNYVYAFAAALLIVACASQEEPAAKMISDIEALVKAASADATQYVPDQLTDVESKLGALRASFDKKDYKAVLSGAPPVMSAAQGLASAAAAKKDEVLKGLNDEWTSLASALPGNANAIQSRIEFLSKKVNQKMASGVDLDAAKASLSDANLQWSKAQAAFAGGNLKDAVANGKSAKTSYDALAASMKLDFKEPAAVTDTSPMG